MAWDPKKTGKKFTNGSMFDYTKGSPFEFLSDMSDGISKWGERFNPSSAGEDKAAREALQKMAQGWEGLQVPELGDLSLDSYNYQGDFRPETYASPTDLAAREISAEPDVRFQGTDAVTADRTELGATDFNNVNVDPALKEKQMRALGGLDEIVDGGGLTLKDQANLQKMRTDTAAGDRGRRDAIRQNMAARGMGGGGMDLLAQLQSNQAATDRDAQTGLDTAAMAQERALNAMMQQGQMAGSMRGQDFDEQSRIAQARDAIAQFNAQNANMMSLENARFKNQNAQFNADGTMRADLSNRDARMGVKQQNANAVNDMAQYNQGNRINVGLSNTSTKNQAGSGNWQARQGIANQNTDVANKAKLYNTVDKPQAQYDMKTKKLAGQSGALQAESEFWTKAGDRKASKFGSLMGGGSTLGAAYMASDERVKSDVEDLSDADIEEFLGALKPKTFKYKAGQGDGDPGKKAGFLMQDIEGTKVGEVIGRETEDGTKAFDPQGLQGVMLAALKKLSEEK